MRTRSSFSIWNCMAMAMPMIVPAPIKNNSSRLTSLSVFSLVQPLQLVYTASEPFGDPTQTKTARVMSHCPLICVYRVVPWHDLRRRRHNAISSHYYMSPIQFGPATDGISNSVADQVVMKPCNVER